MTIHRWPTASHNPKVEGNRGFWWAEAHRNPGVVPPPTLTDQGKRPGHWSFGRRLRACEVSFVRDLSAIGWDRLGQVTESRPPTAPATDRSFGHVARDGRRSVMGAWSGTAPSLRCAPDPSA